MIITETFNTAETNVSTPLGVLRAWSCNGDHLALATEVNKEGVADHVTINRVDFRINIHLQSAAYYAANPVKGDWASEANRTEIEKYGWSSGRGMSVITRVDWDNVREMHGSFAAQDKARSTLTEWAAAWLATEDGKALLAAGQVVADRRERNTLTNERDELLRRIAEIDERLGALRQEVSA